MPRMPTLLVAAVAPRTSKLSGQNRSKHLVWSVIRANKFISKNFTTSINKMEQN